MTGNRHYTPDELKAGERFFLQECTFAWAAATRASLPDPSIGEIAFIGRSNVGKSSLINALTNRKGLARSSNTPGRTQQINFFDLGGVRALVDLPGYGYAVASKTKVAAWNELVESYILGRATLKTVVVLVDSRHGLKDLDREMLYGLTTNNISHIVVLTKADKVKYTELEKTVAAVAEEIGDKDLFTISAEKKTGIPELRAYLAAI